MSKGRSKNKVKRSKGSLPRGVPHKASGGGSGISPFEYAKTTNSASRVKHHVHNRVVPGQRKSVTATNTSTISKNGGNVEKIAQSSLAKSIQRRKIILQSQLQNDRKANKFIDRRIGEAGQLSDFYRGKLPKDDAMLKRIVQERVRRSKRQNKFSLEDDADDGGAGGGLTHKGKVIDETYTGKLDDNDYSEIQLSDDDDEDLDKVDTMMHFGGGRFDKDNLKEGGAYGAYGNDAGGGNLGEVYRSRKEELEDRIRRKKMEKAEKLKRKEDQAETFENMDESFQELAKLLQFRDKEKERVEKSQKRKLGTLDVEEKEMEDWDKEMKEYLFERKVKATDRTKTPEEIAKEEADRLHELETKRLARMNGEFEEDDLSDISDDEEDKKKMKRKRRRKNGIRGKGDQVKNNSDHVNPEEMDSDDDGIVRGKGGEDEEEREVRFTADGLVYVDKDGKVVGKVADSKNEDAKFVEDSDGSDSESKQEDFDEERFESSMPSDHDLGGSDDDASSAESNGDESDSDDESGNALPVFLTMGMKVQANYRVNEQYGGKSHWYNGTITAVKNGADGNKYYDVTYDDGDFEEEMAEENVRPVPKTKEEKEKEKAAKLEAVMAKKKKQKAKKRAKESLPFVFEVPTTLEALHDLIATHASTGADASLIIQRIHASNSVRLNHKNKEKMQNFYDVLLRRFIAVGDAIFESGNGGADLDRYRQLDAITKTLYLMSQDSPECAAAVWSRRLGFLQKALGKRLRDVEVTTLGDACIEGQFTAFPSTGTILLMRGLPHIFPPTDFKHPVVTPALILLGQILAQTPVKSQYDVVVGLFCSGLMIEYTKGAKRLPPEAVAFLAGVLRLFADDDRSLGDSPLPSLGLGCRGPLLNLRKQLSSLSSEHALNQESAKLSLEKSRILSNSNPFAILMFSLHLIQLSIGIIGQSDEGPEKEIFSEIVNSLLCIDMSAKDAPLPSFVKKAIANVASVASRTCASNTHRRPLQRRKSASAKDLAIKSLAPRMENPSKYSMSRDKGKSQKQAELDRNRREYKREHKAAMRELRLDNAFIESERRKAKDKSDATAKEKRHKNFAWLEQEQATMNQQVRLGGGLLAGGGMGAAKAKVKTGKLGIKKGGKF